MITVYQLSTVRHFGNKHDLQLNQNLVEEFRSLCQDLVSRRPEGVLAISSSCQCRVRCPSISWPSVASPGRSICTDDAMDVLKPRCAVIRRKTRTCSDRTLEAGSRHSGKSNVVHPLSDFLDDVAHDEALTAAVKVLTLQIYKRPFLFLFFSFRWSNGSSSYKPDRIFQSIYHVAWISTPTCVSRPLWVFGFKSELIIYTSIFISWALCSF